MIARSYQLIDYGVDNAQYFQGHGIANTDWEATATGAGNDIHEAVDDALENLAQQGWDVDEIEDEIKAELKAAKDVSASKVSLKTLEENLTDEDVIREAELDADATPEEIAEARTEVAKEMLSDDASELFYYVAIDVSEDADEPAATESND